MIDIREDDLEDELDDELALDIEIEEELDIELDVQALLKPEVVASYPDELAHYLHDIATFSRISADEEIALAKLIKAGVEAKATLTDVNQVELAPIIKAGQAARNKFIEANYKLVVSIARKYYYACTTAVTFLDIIQSGNLGLMKAVDRFDHTKSIKFSTYATWWIRQHITRDLLNTAYAIRIPIHVQEIISKIYQLERSSATAPSIDELAEALKMSPHIIARTVHIRDTKNVTSLDKNTAAGDSDSEVSLLDAVPSDTLSPDKVHAAEELDQQLQDILSSKLTDREQYIIVRRFGLTDDRPVTLERLGDELGVTRERVRQIEAIALRKLRAPRVQTALRGLIYTK